MRTLLLTTTCALTLAFGASFSAPPIPVEEAVEALAIHVRVATDRTGRISGRQCEACELHTFPVTPRTRFSANGVPVGVDELRLHNGLPATIIYNLRSGEATRIVW